MKKKALLLSLTLVCIVAFVSPVFSEMKNELDNFRGIPWGLAPPQNNRNQWGLIETAPIAGPFKKVYERKNERLHLGDAKIYRVYYFFHRDLGFALADLTTSGQKNYELIRKACIDNWGKPDQDTRDINKEHGYDFQETIWFGQRVTARLECSRNVDYSTRLSIHLKDYFQFIKKDLKEMSQRDKGF